MIYTKKANFPYPVLMNFTDDYKDAEFECDVALKDDANDYMIEIDWEISSEFIRDQLESGNASLVLIIKSKDNQFHILPYGEKLHKKISRTRLCLNARTVMQLMILSNKEISFKDNTDINEFYEESRNEIVVHPGQVLGFSNTVIFDGSQDKPYELFEKRVDETISSDVEIRLGEETILIVYKNRAYEFNDLPNGRELNYPYIYLGLQKALCAFLVHMNPEFPEEGIMIDEIEPPENALESKLYSLMQAKNISELTWDNLDEVIYTLSDNIVGRYSDVVRRLSNGD